MTNSEITPELLEKPARLELLLARVGYAVWQLAECEDSVAGLVLIKLRSARGVGEEAGLKLLAAEQRKTFGQGLSALREANALPGHLQDRADKLVRERNWVVHQAKREHRGALNKPQVFNQLIARLKAIGEEATQLNTLLAKEIEEFAVSSGVDRAQVDAAAAELAASWGY